VGAFDAGSTADVDVLEVTEHRVRWRGDLALLRHCGVRRVRYPLPWHRIAGRPGRLDWRAVDEVVEELDERNSEVVLELLAGPCIPRWFREGVGAPDGADAFVAFAAAAAERYPSIAGVTLIDDPTPDQVPLVERALDAFRAAAPAPAHVWMESASGDGRLAALDRFGGDVDVVGVDHRGSELASVVVGVAERYGRPVLVRTGRTGTPAERAAWLEDALEQCRTAVEAGVDVDGLAWSSLIDGADDDGLVPSGVYWLDDDLERHPSEMSRAFAAAARGGVSRPTPAPAPT
jgi:hypothetical protein